MELWFIVFLFNFLIDWLGVLEFFFWVKLLVLVSFVVRVSLRLDLVFNLDVRMFVVVVFVVGLGLYCYLFKFWFISDY